MPVPVIPWLVAALGRMFASRIGQWIAAALIWFGLTVATNEVLIDPLIDRVMSALPGMPPLAMQWVQFLRLTDCIVMVLSAYGARAAVGGIKAAIVRKRA